MAIHLFRIGYGFVRSVFCARADAAGMRPSFALALALALAIVPSLVPLAAADTERGSGVGINLGLFAPGTWDIYHFSWPGGTEDIRLSSAQPPVFFADYNLYLYAAGSLADGVLADSERIAQSVLPGSSPERIVVALAPATNYAVAVAP